jgi:hypothetical protein
MFKNILFQIYIILYLHKILRYLIMSGAQTLKFLMYSEDHKQKSSNCISGVGHILLYEVK